MVGMRMQTDLSVVARSIAETVRAPYAGALVDAYFDPSGGFAGALFDGFDDGGLLADNPPDRFTADDITAVSLLDVRFGPAAVRALLRDDTIQDALGAVPQGVVLWTATPNELDVATRLWDLVRKIEGVGRTRASKLLARKRPHTVPIVDSVIASALHLQVDTWLPLASALSNDQLRRDIEALRPAQVSSELSVLRLLDVVVWMSHSRSAPAVRAQIAVGAPPTRSIFGRQRQRPG